MSGILKRQGHNLEVFKAWYVGSSAR